MEKLGIDRVSYFFVFLSLSAFGLLISLVSLLPPSKEAYAYQGKNAPSHSERLAVNLNLFIFPLSLARQARIMLRGIFIFVCSLLFAPGRETIFHCSPLNENYHTFLHGIKSRASSRTNGKHTVKEKINLPSPHIHIRDRAI